MLSHAHEGASRTPLISRSRADGDDGYPSRHSGGRRTEQPPWAEHAVVARTDCQRAELRPKHRLKITAGRSRCARERSLGSALGQQRPGARARADSLTCKGLLALSGRLGGRPTQHPGPSRCTTSLAAEGAQHPLGVMTTASQWLGSPTACCRRRYCPAARGLRAARCSQATSRRLVQ